MDRVLIESGWLDQLVRLSLTHPLKVIGSWVVFLIVCIGGITQLRFDTSTNSFLEQEDPAWDTYQRSLAEFGGDELLVVALEGDVAWSRSLLRDLIRLSGALERVPGIRRVDSLATVPLIRTARDGALRLDAGLTDAIEGTEADWDRYRAWLALDRIAPRSLVSDDGRVFAINLLLDDEIVADRQQVVDAVRSELDGRSAWMTGVPVFRTEVNSRTLEQTFIFVPLTLCLLCTVLLIAFGSIQALIVALMVGLLGAVAGLGAMGFVGVPLSLTTTMLPSLVLAIGCAYSMHMLTASQRTAESGTALVGVVGPVARPMGLSGLTTVIGFLAMATIPVAAVRELATYGALGVFVAGFSALSLAPALLAVWPMSNRRTRFDSWVSGSVRRALVDLVIRRRPLVILAWSLVGLCAALGITRLHYATDIIEWFPRGMDVREDYESIRHRLSGITPINIMIDVVEGSGRSEITESVILEAIDGLTADLRRLDGVGKVLAMTDPLRQIHRVLSRDSAGELPDDAGLVSQYLLLLESVEHMRDVLKSDHTAANVLVRLDDNSSKRIVELASWVDSWWEKYGVPGVSVATTGIMYEFGRAEEAIARGQVSGLILAFGILGLVLVLVFRDAGVACLGLLVNAIPLGAVYGGLGLAGLELDAGTACIGATALGIGVDDTIHVLWGYTRRRRAGYDEATSLDRCLMELLPALVFTTATVAIGFAVLVLSPFSLVANLGWVTATIMVLCLSADLTLLPALLTVITRKRWKQQAK